MDKEFDNWNKEKKLINNNKEYKLYHEREIWWCSLGLNIGFEQDGTGAGYQRPVLVLKAMSRNTCYVVPLTSSPKKHKLRIPVGLVDGKQASALMSQIRLVDTKRFVNKLGFLDKDIFLTIRKAAKDLL